MSPTSKILIYTVNMGGYDTPIPFPQGLGDYDLAVVTDSEEVAEAYGPISAHIIKRNQDSQRASRLFKCRPWLVMPDKNYTHSLYIDANIELLTDPGPLFDTLENEDCDIALFDHGCTKGDARSTVREEMGPVVRHKGGNREQIERFIEFMEMDGYKDEFLFCGSVIARRHSTKVHDFGELWWSMINFWCHRDQITLPYCLHKSNLEIFQIMDDFRDCKMTKHHKHKPFKK